MSGDEIDHHKADIGTGGDEDQLEDLFIIGGSDDEGEALESPSALEVDAAVELELGDAGPLGPSAPGFQPGMVVGRATPAVRRLSDTGGDGQDKEADGKQAAGKAAGKNGRDALKHMGTGIREVRDQGPAMMLGIGFMLLLVVLLGVTFAAIFKSRFQQQDVLHQSELQAHHIGTREKDDEEIIRLQQRTEKVEQIYKTCMEAKEGFKDVRDGLVTMEQTMDARINTLVNEYREESKKILEMVKSSVEGME